MNRTLTIAIGLGLTLVGAVAVPAVAESFDDPPAAPADPYAAVFSAMQRDLGLRPDQARGRIAAQQQAAAAETRFRREFGSGFGGVWMSTDGGRFTIGVSSEEQARQVRDSGGQAQVVRYSAQALDGTKAALDARARRRAPSADVAGWYVDVATNDVVVLARGDERAARDFVADAGVKAAPVRVLSSAEQPRLYASELRGGDPFLVRKARCSVGLPVDGGFVTAGHCGAVGADTTGGTEAVVMGSVASANFPGADYAFVRTDAKVQLPSEVNDYAGGGVSIAGSIEAPVGASVCRSGATTGWRCGVIQAKNSTVNYAEGTVSGLTRTNACAEPGDSGGPWLAGDQAQGVTSGGSGDCVLGGTTYFQPINEALQAYGLTLRANVPTPSGAAGKRCQGYATTGSATVAAGVSAYQPSGTYYITRKAGTHRACVDGPAGSDVTLTMERWTGKAWTTVATADSSGDDQELSSTAGPGYYRYRVDAVRGSGPVNIGFTAP